MKKTPSNRPLGQVAAGAAFSGNQAARIENLEKALSSARDSLAQEAEKRRALASELKTVREQTKALTQIVNHSPSVIFTWLAQQDLPVVFVAENVRRFGYLPEDFYSGRLKYTDIVHAADRQRVSRQMLDYCQSRKDDKFICTYRITTAARRMAWVDHHTQVIRGPEGNITHLQGALLDITDRKTAQMALTESESKFRSLTEEALVGVYIIQQGFFRYVNPEFARIFGYRPEDIIDKIGPNLLVLPEDQSLVAQNIQKRLNGEIASLHYEFRGVTRDNRIVNIEVFGNRTQVNGKPAVIGSLLDITARKQAERDLRLTQYAVDQSATAILRVDPSSRITYANLAASRLLGYSEQELMRMTIPDIDPQWTAEFWKHQGLAMLRRNRVNRFETEHIRKDGKRYPVEVISYLAEFEEAEQYYAFFMDISERRRAEEEIRRHREHLEELVQERTMELTTAKEQAEVASRTKSEFLANMSHEIRTPLNGVIGMIDLLRDTDLTTAQLEFAGTAATCANSLLSVINDILDFSKIEAGKLDFEHILFDLREVMDDLAEMLSFQAQEKNLEVTCFLDPQAPNLFWGDPMRLRQVLLNLATNALKFTQEGEVNIRVTVKARTSEWVELCFAVTDSGIGVPESLSHRLFKPFSQVDSSTTREFGGTGLGLAICKKLVDMMGGRIGVRSRQGQGSSFWFTVRLDLPAPSGQGPDLCEFTEELRGKSILAVDDHAANREILNAYLLACDCKVQLADNGPQAFELMNRAATADKPFDLVIIDDTHPSMDGIALGRSIMARERFKALPMVIMTLQGRSKDWDLVRDMASIAFLAKPIKLSGLRKALVSALAMGRYDPFANMDKETATAGTAEADQPLQGRILLAEDNVINRKLAQHVLEKLGHRVDAVTNGRMVLEALAQRHYDLLLMDVQMPEMDGLEAARLIRGQGPDSNRIPIIAMTAHAMSGDREKCLAAGMDDYISKPIDSGVLSAKLLYWLGKEKNISTDDG